MKAFALESPESADITTIDLAVQAPQGETVIVDVSHCGVCHTDTHLREGGYHMGSAGFMRLVDRGLKYPIVMGHEIAGVVSAIGPDVTGLAVGDRVVVFPWLGCGKCPTCRAGDENKCPVGAQALGVARHGGYAEQVVVPSARYCVPLGDLDPAWGATLACSGVTAYAAVRQAQPLEPEQSVVVIGAGGVGLMAVASLAALGHRNICVIDRSDTNFKAAREMGARHTVVTGDDTRAEDVIKASGEPAAAVLDFVNAGSTAQLAFGLLAKGGVMVQVGLFGGEFTISTVGLALQQKRVIGSYVGRLDDLKAVMDLAREGRLPKPPIDQREFTLEQLIATLDGLAAGQSRGRTVLHRA